MPIEFFDLSAVADVVGPSGTAIIEVDASGDNRIVVITNLSARPARFAEVGCVLRHAGLLLANRPVEAHADTDLLDLEPYEARVYRVS